MASTTTLFLLSALITLTLAANCKTGLDYCGFNLLGIGDYQPQINAALEKASLQTANSSISTNTLFHCDGGYNGDISVINYCTNGCIDGGPGKSDFCNKASVDPASSSTLSTSTLSTSTLSTSTGTTFSTTTSSTASSTTASSTTASSTDMSGASTKDNESSGNTPVGAIVGGVVGGVAGLALIGLGLFLFFKKSRQGQDSKDENAPELKSTQEKLLKHFNGVHSTSQGGTVLEAPGDVAGPRYELSGAPINAEGTRYELN